MHKLVTFDITPLHICELFGTKVIHTLDRKFTFCQTAQFYLKYSSLTSFMCVHAS